MVHGGGGEGKCQGKELPPVSIAAQGSDHKRTEKCPVGGLGSSEVLTGANPMEQQNKDGRNG